MEGWSYTLWSESLVQDLIETKCPEFWDIYSSLKYPIQRLGLAKYLVAHYIGGLVVDLDVLPNCHVNEFVGEDVPYIFDRCSRRCITANDFFTWGRAGCRASLVISKRTLRE